MISTSATVALMMLATQTGGGAGVALDVDVEAVTPRLRKAVARELPGASDKPVRHPHVILARPDTGEMVISRTPSGDMRGAWVEYVDQSGKRLLELDALAESEDEPPRSEEPRLERALRAVLMADGYQPIAGVKGPSDLRITAKGAKVVLTSPDGSFATSYSAAGCSGRAKVIAAIAGPAGEAKTRWLAAVVAVAFRGPTEHLDGHTCQTVPAILWLTLKNGRPARAVLDGRLSTPRQPPGAR